MVDRALKLGFDLHACLGRGFQLRGEHAPLGLAGPFGVIERQIRMLQNFAGIGRERIKHAHPERGRAMRGRAPDIVRLAHHLGQPAEEGFQRTACRPLDDQRKLVAAKARDHVCLLGHAVET